MIRLVRIVWIALAGVPLLLLRDPVVGSMVLAAFAAVVWLFGWKWLSGAATRDPGAAVLRGLGSGRAGPAFAVMMLLTVEAVASLVSPGAAGLLALLAGAGLLRSWSRSGEAEALRQRVATGLLLTTSLAIGLTVTELLFRSPMVVSWTGGDAPGGARWARTHYDRLWEQNPLHLRSRHLGPKRPGVFRILVLGDSFTWGYFVARTEDVWPYVMERGLSTAEHPVEVIDLGVNGASTTDEETRLEGLGWLFEPDLIVLQYTLNDPISGRYAGHFRTLPLLPGLNGFLDAHSYFFAFLNARWAALQLKLLYPESENALFRESFSGWGESRGAMGRIAEAASARGIPAVLVLFPLFTGGVMDSLNYPFHPAHHAVREAAEKLGLPFIDLGPTFWALGREGSSWWAVPQDPHPGVAAHRLAGETVARALSPFLSRRSEDRVDERRKH
jgi:hypothetical protein